MSELISNREQSNIERKEPEVEISRSEVKQVVAQVISEYSGPIPPPNIIKKYEEILPGSADRILNMAEQQSMHRREMDKKLLNAQSRDSLFGIIFAFVLGIGCLIVAAVITINTPSNAGAICGSLFGVAGISSIVGPFLKINRSDKKNQD